MVKGRGPSTSYPLTRSGHLALRLEHKTSLARAAHNGSRGHLPGLEAHGLAAIGVGRLVGDEEVPALEAVDFLALTLLVVQLAPPPLPAGNGIPLLPLLSLPHVLTHFFTQVSDCRYVARFTWSLVILSFFRMFSRWRLTVAALTPRRCAMSLVRIPLRIMLQTLISVGESE